MRSSLTGSLALGIVAAAVLGVAAGVTGTLAHQVVLVVLGVAVPVGLVLALALTAAVQATAVLAWPRRTVVAAGVLGWAAAVYAGLATGPGGDFLVPRPPGGLGAAWLLLGPAALLGATLASRRVPTGPGTSATPATAGATAAAGTTTAAGTTAA